MPHEDETNKLDKLNKYERRLTQVLSAISDLDTTENSDPFISLSSIPDFTKLFGYYTPNNQTRDIRSIAQSQDPFSSVIKNICYRRTFFYISKFREALRKNQSSTNLSFLLNYFGQFRRTAKSFSGDSLLAFFQNNDITQSFALSRLYETFIDSELFTALLHLQSFTQSSKTKKAAKAILPELLKKVQDILNNHISDSCEIRESPQHGSIKDEANIFWGLRVLHHEIGAKFHLGGRFSGMDAFEALFIKLLNRLSIFQLTHKRIFPKEDDLIYEITPEVNTLEKTELYVLLNCLELMSDNGLTDAFRAEVSNYIQVELERIVLNQGLPINLYFVSLKAQCLRLYIQLSAKNIITGTTKITNHTYDTEKSKTDTKAVSENSSAGTERKANRIALIVALIGLAGAIFSSPLWTPFIKKAKVKPDEGTRVPTQTSSIQKKLPEEGKKPLAPPKGSTLDSQPIQIVYNISKDKLDKTLLNLRESKSLRELASLETGRNILETPPGTYFFLHWTRLSFDAGNLQRTLNYPGVQSFQREHHDFEIHKNNSGNVILLAFISDETAASLSKPIPTIQKEIVIFASPWKNFRNLAMIPISRIVKSSYRSITIDENKELSVLDICLK